MLINSLQQLILHVIFVVAKAIHFIIFKNDSSHNFVYDTEAAYHWFLQFYEPNYSQAWY